MFNVLALFVALDVLFDTFITFLHLLQGVFLVFDGLP